MPADEAFTELFRKTIASLACIEKISHNKHLVKEATIIY